MAISSDFLNYVLDQISTLRDLPSRRMFGGVGLYCEEVFFGIISSDVLYFKVGDDNRADYEVRGMQPFRPYVDRPQVSMSYFEVPVDILEDRDECGAWARRSVAAARVTGRRGPTRAPRRRC